VGLDALGKAGDRVERADTLGTVPEGAFTHRVMVPFGMFGSYTVKSVKPAGSYSVKDDEVAVLEDKGASHTRKHDVLEWPVKRAVDCYAERLKPTEPMVTKNRIIDTFFPVAKGGTYCIPGPFGAGKTVLQQVTSRNADVDIVIIAACGERAGEVVETLKEFPELIDPRTGKSLMERTIIVCNTSSMPVAAREASVYTAVTMAEYYRQMGLDVLLLADSTSRWAQAMREMSGRLEEIPGEEAFPAYLESVIASFYERAGIVRLKTAKRARSPSAAPCRRRAATSRSRSPRRPSRWSAPSTACPASVPTPASTRPSIPLESWSKYKGIMDAAWVAWAHWYLERGSEVGQMMKVVGEEGTSMDDFLVYLKGEFLDAVYLQQNSFDPSTPP
jgi:V/A-type H+/Na+-transporting ATPase subunit A